MNFEKSLDNLSNQVLTVKEGDLTVSIALCIAEANSLLEQLDKEILNVTKLGNRRLVKPSLVKAWREILHIRKDLDNDYLNNDIDREVSITKYGRVKK